MARVLGTLAVPVLTSLPAGGRAGQLAVQRGVLYYYDGQDWRPVPDVLVRTRREIQLLANVGSTTATAVGTGNPPAWSPGNNTGRYLANADDAIAPWLAFASDRSGVSYGLHHFGLFRMGWNAELIIQVRPMDNTNVAYWIGAFSADPGSSSHTPPVDMATFRFSSLADGSTWRAITAAGTAAQTVTDTAVPVQPGRDYRLRIAIAPNEVQFFIDDQFIVRHTTHLPAPETTLGWASRIVPTANLRRTLQWSRTAITY